MSTETTSLMNRADFDASKSLWMHVCRLGEHPWTSEDGTETIIQVIDEEACRLMANRYPLSGPQARIDVDHKSMDPQNTTEASGWGKQAEPRADGVWVRAELTSHGAPLINGKVYQFTSPCFPRAGLVPLGGNRYRVTQLGVIALTNDPNLRGQQPLTNRRAQSAKPNTNTPTSMDYKAILLTLLGLPNDASDEAINTAVNAAKGKSETMNSRITELETQLVNRDLDEHGITDVEQRKLLSPMLANTATRTHALGMLGKMKPATTPTAPLHNRKGAPVPGTDKQLSQAEAAEAEAEKAKAAWIGNRSRELKAGNASRPHRDCFAQAEAEYASRA
jgi:phage I-like protein